MNTATYAITISVAALLTVWCAYQGGRFDSYDVPVSGLNQPMPEMASAGPAWTAGASRMGR